MSESMYRHVVAFALKFISIGVLLGITLGAIGGASLSAVLGTTTVLSIVAYLVGDMFVLPSTSNMVATGVDVITGWIVLSMMLPEAAEGTALLLSVIGLAAVEYAFHMYLKANVLPRTHA